MDSPAPDFDAPIDGYTPPLSLWKLVEQYVNEYERGEIKNLLGEDLVEQTLELHQEVEALLEIWRDCRESASQAGKKNRLPEPPGMRDRLVQEILFFVENVKEKAQDQGRAEDTYLKKYDKRVIDYALNSSRAPSVEFSRANSVIGRDGRETPAIPMGSPASDRISTSSYSTMSEDVEAMSDKLNILKLDEVSVHLRSFLVEEKEYLMQDLRFLQDCIEEENNNSEKTLTEPSIIDLRDQRLKLEKEMLADVFAQQNISTQKINQQIKHGNAKTRSPILSNGPLKAVHDHAPDGIVLKGNASESLINKTQLQLADEAVKCEPSRTGSKSGRKRAVVQIASVAADRLPHNVNIVKLPECAKDVERTMSRPSSALKFRSMVISSRQSAGDS